MTIGSVSTPTQSRRRATTSSRRGLVSLDNSVVRDWSWPCVLVFVQEWVERGDFAASPDQMVPRALFLARRAGDTDLRCAGGSAGIGAG